MTNHVQVRRFKLAPGLMAGITTRHGGVSDGPYATLNLGYHVGDDPTAVEENRRRACAAFGSDALTVADQQHRATVAIIDDGLVGAGHSGLADSQERLPATDAMVTHIPGATLCVLVADCAPVVLWDPVRKALGVAHCGRGGAVAGVVPATIETMASEFGSRPVDLWVGIGPHIARSSYEVGPVEAEATAMAFPGTDVVLPMQEGRGCVDLTAAISAQLRTAGVDAGRVEAWPEDTRNSTDEFYSDRAERPCGRFGLLAMIEP